MDADKAQQILDMLADGVSLKKAANTVGLTHGAVFYWIEKDPVFADKYTRAREVGYKLLADEILEISDDASGDVVDTDTGPRSNPEFTARSRLRVDSRKWMLSKMLPKIYGEKLDHNVTGTVDMIHEIKRTIVKPSEKP